LEICRAVIMQIKDTHSLKAKQMDISRSAPALSVVDTRRRPDLAIASFGYLPGRVLAAAASKNFAANNDVTTYDCISVDHCRWLG
jgi:hypothetical protein